MASMSVTRRTMKTGLTSAVALVVAGGCADGLMSPSRSNQPGLPAYSYSTDCNGLGAVACKGIEVSRQYSHFLAWGSTFTVGGVSATALTVHGVGHYRRGIGFPGLFEISDTCLNVQSCSDTEEVNHTCQEEPNSISLMTYHTAFVSGHLYGPENMVAGNECDDNPGGGSGGPSGPTCETEYLIVEVWNATIGQWEYYDTYPVEICT